MNAASYQLCFCSKTWLNAAECIEKGHPKSKCAGKNQKNVVCFLLSSSFLQAEKAGQSTVSKITSLQLVSYPTLSVLPVCVQLDNPIMGEPAPSATCSSLGLILKCLFQDTLT